MDISNILSHVDHTLLKPEATWDQIKTLCDEAMEFGCATVCIPPAYVKPAADYVQGNLKLCTVIGFPNGYNTMASKIFETKDAVENGASEIDMVINVGLVKDRKWKELTEEIAGVKAACHTGAMHSWATRSPGARVTGAAPRFTRPTLISPR